MSDLLDLAILAGVALVAVELIGGQGATSAVGAGLASAVAAVGTALTNTGAAAASDLARRLGFTLVKLGAVYLLVRNRRVVAQYALQAGKWVLSRYFGGGGPPAPPGATASTTGATTTSSANGVKPSTSQAAVPTGAFNASGQFVPSLGAPTTVVRTASGYLVPASVYGSLTALRGELTGPRHYAGATEVQAVLRAIQTGATSAAAVKAVLGTAALATLAALASASQAVAPLAAALA